jgi:hypothetical protein
VEEPDVTVLVSVVTCVVVVYEIADEVDDELAATRIKDAKDVPPVELVTVNCAR